MTLNLKSRHLQFCVLIASLLFVLWLSTSMWLTALAQRQQAYDFKQVDHQGEVLFKLADALAAERQLLYGLFNSESVDIELVEQLRQLSAKTDEIVHRNRFVFLAMKSSMHPAIEHGHAGHGMSSTREVSPEEHATVNRAESAAVENVRGLSREMSNQQHGGSGHGTDISTLARDTIISRIIANLRQSDEILYQQLLIPAVTRNPMFGMGKFHEYGVAIESIDGIRHRLHTQSTQSLPEHYVITKLKDAFWEFREYAAQVTSLLEGITTMANASNVIPQIDHQAVMLMELNTQLDLSWSTLYKTIIASGNERMLGNVNDIAVWYNANFRSMGFGLVASTRNSAVPVSELQDWLEAAYRLTAQTEDIRAQASLMTETLIDNMIRRTNVNLIKVSVLVFFSFFMTLASVLFFRRVDKQAHQDELTGLDNRRMFSIAMEKCLSAPDSEAGILMIDLDRFKHINDTMGHSAGDALLKEVSVRISSAGTECVSVSRLGGDEFAMLFDNASVDKMQDVATTVRQHLIDPFRIGGATLKIGSSIGLAKAPRDATTPDALIQAADLAMYCAKKSGTNQISVYDSEVDQSMMMAARTVSELQSALLNNEFELHYQPQFNIAQARVLSAEALIRWNHPERGFLTPNHFIAIAEDNGLMPTIGDWVIEEACRQAAEWLYEKNMPLRVAVNISADHFFQPDFVKLIVDTLEKYKLPPQLLEVEVTESVAMNDINHVVESLQQLRDLSVHVALDDFGTGYSSLSYLQELPLDTLKIDKSFIQNMLQGNTQKESITETIVALGNQLNLETVAEGVETLDQLAAVSDMQISVVQGFYYSRPVSATELEFVVQQLNDTDIKKKAA